MKLFVLLSALLVSQALFSEEVSIDQAGIKLNANLERSDGWPGGAVVLLTHGTLSHNKSELMVALQSLFGENGISSLAVNLGLGVSDRHGVYDCKTPHNHTHEDAIEEMGHWLNWLVAQGAAKVTLLGHSRGGNQTAWYAAERDSERIDKVILIAPGTWTLAEAKREYKAKYGKDLTAVLEKAGAMIAEGKGDQQIAPVDFLYCQDGSASARSIVSYYGADERKNTLMLLDKINKPVLVFAGSQDKVVENLGKALLPLKEGGRIEAEIIDGADHFFRDLYTEDLVDRIVEFLGD